MKKLGISIAAFLLVACTQEAAQAPDDTETTAASTENEETSCPVSILVLGVAQDAGKPQLGNADDPAWSDPSLRRSATSIALIDRRGEKTRRWIFDVTPDIKDQLHALNLAAPVDDDTLVDGVFITHAHIGHYAGLMMFGHEAAGVQNLQTFVMPQMADFLTNNGPWSQLVRYYNITLAIMSAEQTEIIGPGISVTPFLVPHRQEFSEVVGFLIKGPEKSAIFIPDIDSWEDWDQEGTRIEDKIAEVDIAYLDATFYANGEIPGRDMSGFPHPFVSHSMSRFENLPAAEKSKVRFIHMNHTNPLLNPDAEERTVVKDAGFNIADEGEELCL